MASLSWWEVASRLLAAAALGGALGLQREYDGQDAGFRTHLLVVLGSALFGLLSVGGFDTFMTDRASTNVTVDVTRIAAYVATGIGFIGGGAILKYGGKVSGITTAASLWCGAAIGVAAGLAQWTAAVVTTGIVLTALAVLQPVGRWINGLGRRHRSILSVYTAHDADLGAVVRAVMDAGGAPTRVVCGRDPDDGGFLHAEFAYRPPAPALDQLSRQLMDLPGIRVVDLEGNHDRA